MFKYKLPDGLNTNTYYNAEGEIKFEPPVYELRYSTVIRILEDPFWDHANFKKVVDFGCAEMRLLALLRRIDKIEHILEVDIDEEVLKCYQQRAVPLVSDYLRKRETPLRIEVLKGSMGASVENLRNVDVVIGVEVIEHLYADTLDASVKNIFGFMQPKLAIFTTPNSEFNILFEPLLPNGFRHHDHKFEWTRSEFKMWAHDICYRYSNYSVSFMGVGKPPQNYKKIGYVSQIAIFARNDILNIPLTMPLVADVAADPNPEVQFKTVYEIDFPFTRDERTKEQRILDESIYHISRCRRIERYFNKERCIYQIPIAAIMEYVTAVGGTKEELHAILHENSYNVEDDFIIMPEFDEEDDEWNGDDLDDCMRYPGASEDIDEINDELSNEQNKYQYDSEEAWD